MNTSQLNVQPTAFENIHWRGVFWLSAVTLTLGLGLLAWKRPVTDEVAVLEPAVAADAKTLAVTPVPKMVVVRVCDVQLLPVWAGAVSDTVMIEEEYPQTVARRVA